MTPSISLRLRTAARSRTLAFVAATVLPFAWLAATPATGQLDGEGADGQTLIAEYDGTLGPDGADVTVSGTGYDESKGIYVAVCVDNGAGERPTPCIGGVDMSGDGGASGWISSNPPGYGKDLAVPFGPDGSFDIDFTIESGDDATDCLNKDDAPNGCILTTYADHTRLDDRSADVRIPLDFNETAPEPETTTSEPAVEETSPEPTEAESVEATEAAEEPGEDSTTTGAAADADADVDEESAGTPPEFWLWIALAAIALVGAIAVIRTKARKNRAQDTSASDSASTDIPDEPQQPDSEDRPNE